MKYFENTQYMATFVIIFYNEGDNSPPPIQQDYSEEK